MLSIKSFGALLVSFSLLACGGSENPTQPTVDLTKPTAIAAVAGDGQTIRVKSTVLSAVVFRVTNAVGSPLPNVSVSFAVAAGGGRLAAALASTGADGTVTLPQWVVGPAAGPNTVTATVSGLPPASVTATGRLPLWTVMVYMAADNTLAMYGYLNLVQMTQAGVNPEVQVVVQAEFGPEAFSQAGLSPQSIDRPNYDTFRYVMDGSISTPPNRVLIGPTTDIGNVDMTDPTQLRAFIQWANTTAPAQHTVLVLWNHGGDAGGLIEDDTSAPGNYMTVPQLASALSGFPKFDILYFEMCLMAGYEPLSLIQNDAQTVVASEDAEYVAGWDFNRFLTTLYAAPSASTPTLAGRLADAFDAAYAAGPAAGLSETIAAFNMAGFPAVDGAITGLANALLATPAANLTTAANVSTGVQRYDYPWVADAVDLSDTLRAHIADTAVSNAALAVRQAITSPSFLLASHWRSGTRYQQRNESRSHGLTVVMPSVSASSEMPSSGFLGWTAYQQNFSATRWDGFLQRYTASLSSRFFVNLGLNRMTLYQVWDTAFVSKGWMEMLLLEPDGSLYGPAFGSISTSGEFSADAQVTNAYYEAWLANQYVQSGTFYFLGWLVTDPTNYQPLVNIAYRIGTGSTLTSLYGPGTYPRMSFQNSVFNDPNETGAKILSGAYTDLRPLSTWNTAPPAGSLVPATAVRPSTPNFDLTPGQAAPQVSLQQIAKLREVGRVLLQARRANPTATMEQLRDRVREVVPTKPSM